MSKFRVRAIAMAFALLALVSVIVWQHSRARALIAESAALREKIQQTVLREEESRQLREALRLMNEDSQAKLRELVQLRGQAASARQLKEENVRLRGELESVALRTKESSEQDGNSFDWNYGIGARATVNHAKYWGYAMINYATTHGRRFPASFAEAASYFHDELSAEEKAKAIEAADRYELVYHGSQDDLDGLPPESTIIVREKEAWLDPQGRWCKAYSLSDGTAIIRAQEKRDFAEWEGRRIPKAKQERVSAQ
jgi:hypothetical protein